jgi:hypothetical protein
MSLTITSVVANQFANEPISTGLDGINRNGYQQSRKALCRQHDQGL